VITCPAEFKLSADTAYSDSRKKESTGSIEHLMRYSDRSGCRDVLDGRLSGTAVRFGVIGHFLTFR
jgi:hypothetical protein